MPRQQPDMPLSEPVMRRLGRRCTGQRGGALPLCPRRWSPEPGRTGSAPGDPA